LHALCSPPHHAQDGNWTHEKGLVAGPRVTPGDIERILREQAAARSDSPPPPSVVLLAELPGHADGFIGCIEVTTTDAAAAVAAPGQPALDGYLGALACVLRLSCAPFLTLQRAQACLR
jgi:hypothetical protein